MTAQIVPFPRKRPTCGDCAHAAFGVHGVYCIFWREDINNEAVAEECETFESVFSPGDPSYVERTAGE